MLKEFRQERIDFARFHKTAEKQVLPFVRKALRQSYQPIIDALDRYDDIRNIPVESLINKGVWGKMYDDIYQLVGMKAAKNEYYNQQRKTAQSEKAKPLEFLADIWSSLLRDYSIQYTYNISRRLNETTVDLINKMLGDAFEIGIDKMSRIRIFKKDIAHNISSRSLTMSRTETTTIANIGKRAAAESWIQEQGGDGYKVWLGRIIGERETHLETNDTIIPINDHYVVGGHQCLVPGDGNLPPKERINCRCTSSYMTKGVYEMYRKRGRIENGKLRGAS